MTVTEMSTRAGPWFHGGVPRLDVGDEVLPGSVTGLSIERVISITHHYEQAYSYAAFWPWGDVYEVAVEHPTIPPAEEVARRNLEAPVVGPWPPPMGVFHFTVRRAVVIRVAHRGVPNALARSQPRRRVVKRRYAGLIPKSAPAPLERPGA